MNLDLLRRKRSKRLGVKVTGHAGQRRIFFILDRATKKFHGDIALWLQYLTFARKQKAHKKVAQIITTMLRLHPTSPELWVYAADYAMDERGDVTEARSYMQRGLRFCSQSKSLWTQYLKLEMIYIAKIVARRHVLGLEVIKSSSEQDQVLPAADMEKDIIPLHSTTVKESVPEHQPINTARPEISGTRVASTPALTGAIPMAIFDSAIKKFLGDAAFGAQMFDVVAEFHQLQCTRRILQHIVDTLMKAAPTSPATLKCFINEPVVGLGATSTELPGALITVLDRFDSTIRSLKTLQNDFEKTRTTASVSRHMVRWIIPYLSASELDAEIRVVLTSLLRTAWGQCLYGIESESVDVAAEVTSLLQDLDTNGIKDLVQIGLDPALKAWPAEPRLLALKASNP